jgi:hypothetical protein
MGNPNAEWKLIRAKMIELDGQRCRRCGRQESISEYLTNSKTPKITPV